MYDVGVLLLQILGTVIYIYIYIYIYVCVCVCVCVECFNIRMNIGVFRLMYYPTKLQVIGSNPSNTRVSRMFP